MKIYLKPEIDIKTIQPAARITSLSEWLSANELSEAGITTYIIQS